MDLSVNPALNHIRLGSGQVTLLDACLHQHSHSDTLNLGSSNTATSVLLWQQPAIKASSMISLDGQMFWVEAVETLVLHFRRVQRLTLRALCGHVLAAPGAMNSLNTGQGMA